MNLIDGQEGLYEVDQASMAFGPQRYMVPRYVLPNTYGRAEREEAAARLIVLCQDQGEWVGISVPRYFAPVNEEMREYFQAQDERLRAEVELEREYDKRLAIWRTELAQWKVRSVLSLGVYTIRHSKPKPPEQPDFTSIEREENPIFSAVPLYGPAHLMEGLAELANRGYIRVERDSESDWDVMFPEPKLLDPLDRYLIPA